VKTMAVILLIALVTTIVLQCVWIIKEWYDRTFREYVDTAITHPKPDGRIPSKEQAPGLTREERRRYAKIYNKLQAKKRG